MIKPALNASSRTMDGLWTPNFESDADKHASILALQSGAAVALYFVLHSRVFACHNSIGVSKRQLAELLGVSVRTIIRATQALEATGLISCEAYKGNGGGSIYRLHDLTALKRDKSITPNKPSVSPSCGQKMTAMTDQIWQECPSTNTEMRGES